MNWMTRLFSRNFLLCTAALALLANPSHAAPESSLRPLEVPDPAYPPQPAFFVVKDQDSVLYILGSQHKIRKHTKWMTPQVRNAFFEAQRIWYEITMEDMSHPILQIKTIRDSQAEQGQTLPVVLSPEDYTRVTKAANRLGLEMSELDQMKPWLAGDILTGTFQSRIDEKKFGAPDSPIKDIKGNKDTIVPTSNEMPKIHPAAIQGGVEDLTSLMTTGREVRSIENVERHVRLFDNLSLEAQRKYLMDSVDKLEDKTDEIKALSKAWRRGDLAYLAEHDVAKMKTDNPSFYDAMLRLRNIEMAARARDIMKGTGIDFFVVGAAHLAGPDSVLELLRSRGYQPTRLYDSQAPLAVADPGRQVDVPLYHIVPENMPKLQVDLRAPTQEAPEMPRLRLMANYVTNACGEYLPLTYKIRHDGNIFEIQTAGGTLFVNPPRNRDSCGTASKIPYVEIPLDVRSMKESHVTSIWLMRGGGLDKFTVEYTDTDIVLTPPDKLLYFKTKKDAPMSAPVKVSTVQ